MAKSGIVTRAVTTQECDWLEDSIEPGKEVFQYTGPTYGCIGGQGVAVTDLPEQLPFYELPGDAITWSN